MSSSPVTAVQNPTANRATWQQQSHDIIGGDPSAVLDRLDAATRLAIDASDVKAQAALSATALAFMATDWSRFNDWREWVTRMTAAEALLQPADRDDLALELTLATGAVACGLLLGDAIESLMPLARRLELLTHAAGHAETDVLQIALAAGALLPWLQMSKNPAAAQTLHARMQLLGSPWPDETIGVAYLRGAWLAKWAQHVHFYDPAKLDDARVAFDDFLQSTHDASGDVKVNLLFRRKRLDAEKVLLEKNKDATELALREMLSTLHAQRPMERVIYNQLVTVIACGQGDTDRATLHVAHMMRDLVAAECPPSVALMYQMVESRVWIATRDYAQAASVLDQHTLNAHTAHVALIRGYADLARALLAHQAGTSAHAALRDHLQRGLSAMRGGGSKLFFVAVPEARGALCALGLRENIETAFVLDALKAGPTPPPIWADENWPWALGLRSFGGFRALGLIEQSLATSKASNRPLSLLKLIVAHGRLGVTVAQAADALWPAQDGDQAENSLSVNLLRLRKMHASADLIVRSDGWLRLDAAQVWTDVAALEAHLEIDAKLHDEAARAAYIKRLFDLYRGECLFGIEDDWALARAAHYRGRVTLATQQVLQHALTDNQPAAAELVITSARSALLDVDRLLNTVHPAQRTTAAWQQLQSQLG